MGSAALVVGAGIAGAACASVLRAAGVEVTVCERGRAPGGRLAAPFLHGRRVDLGAAYFTVSDDAFGAVVDDWRRRGLARPWTDTMDVFGPGTHDRRAGPDRWAAPDGLRALVRDLHRDVQLRSEITAPDETYDVTVLAMPDPQAARIAGDDRLKWVRYEPVVAVALGWPQRGWQLADAAFVNDDPDLALVVDDGSRRGDGAPVLVAHTTSTLAARHLDRPEAVVPAVVAAVRRLLAIDRDPDWTHAHRWSFAKPAGTHGDAPFHLDDRIGICGDSWCPAGAPRVEAAWLSGLRLGTALAERLG